MSVCAVSVNQTKTTYIEILFAFFNKINFKLGSHQHVSNKAVLQMSKSSCGLRGLVLGWTDQLDDEMTYDFGGTQKLISSPSLSEANAVGCI